MDNATVPDKLKAYRFLKDLNQKQMAALLSVSQPYYYGLEADRRVITPDTVDKMKNRLPGFDKMDDAMTRLREIVNSIKN